MLTARVVRRKFIDTKKIAGKLAGPTKVKFGFPAGETDGEQVKIAIFNEFGTRGSGKGFSTPRGGGFGGPIPERPFMRNSFRSNTGKYRSELRSGASKILEGKSSLNEILSKFGNLGKLDIQDEILALSAPPNSPVTIAIKGSSNPLIDTGRMRGAVTYQVTE